MVSKDIIKKEHLEFAIDYIHKNGKKVPNTGVTALLARNADNITFCLIHENHKEILYPPIEVVRVAFLYALEKSGKLRQQCEDKEYPLDFSWNDTSKHLRLWDKSFPSSNASSAKKICRRHYKIIKRNNVNFGNFSDGEINVYLKLLRQFQQVIFYGPPGTGKTYQAKKVIERMLGADMFNKSQRKRWDIVQFHPSYNYEDFVRGVQVKTEKGQVIYKAENRIFAGMCDEASKNQGNAYALIIDEINRANVSSVLGELIYALEYRDKSVSTPYEVDGSKLLTVPPNLYIIGTMNTADRTIGALDYAVRRRFAFVHCPPDKSLIKDNEAKSVFDKVKRIFDDFLSPDFDAADVEIGHSYFMAKGEELHNKIQYQVIPILEEYVKDGVLLETAEDKIDELWEMLDTDSTDSNHPWCCMNVGEHHNRNWDDCHQYGYLGGSGEKIVKQMKKHLRKGNWVFAFINNKGCVGYGEITQEAIPIREFVTQDGTPLLECELRAPKVKENSDNDDSCEWVVGVQWLEVRDRENAVPVKAARRQTIWRNVDGETRQKLDDAFDLITYD